MTMLGRHIVVYGPTCSGKSIVAHHIAQSIKIPHIELDRIFWKPQWIKKPKEEFRSEISTLLSRYANGWVCDGNYFSYVQDLILPLADTMIWLHLPFRTTFLRLLRRTVNNCWKGKILWGTNRETWRGVFLSRDSLLIYALNNRHRYEEWIKKAIMEIPHQASLLELHSTKEVNEFLSEIE